MINDHQISWMKEFFAGLCESPSQKASAEEIVDTFRTLWIVANAATRYRRQPTNASLTMLWAALDRTKNHAAQGKPGRGSL